MHRNCGAGYAGAGKTPGKPHNPQGIRKMKKILLADDSKLARIQTGGLLRKAGYEVIEAANGREAVNICEKDCPDFLLLDLLMPEMEGMEVVTYLQERKINIPYVVLSADIQRATHDAFMKKGALGVITKPPRESELLRVIRENIQADIKK